MTDTTYNVRIWELQTNEGARRTTFTVRWKVDSREWQRTFATRALASREASRKSGRYHTAASVLRELKARTKAARRRQDRKK